MGPQRHTLQARWSFLWGAVLRKMAVAPTPTELQYQPTFQSSIHSVTPQIFTKQPDTMYKIHKMNKTARLLAVVGFAVQ